MLFTIEEEILLCLFDIHTRRQLISEIQSIIPDLDVAEMVGVAQRTTVKLEQMSDEAFSRWLTELSLTERSYKENCEKECVCKQHWHNV